MSKLNFRIQNGFTLIEMLVVIGVLGLMVAIVLPLLSGSRHQAQAAKCLSNLKQLSTAFHLYAGDNHDVLPSEELGAAWYLLLSPYAPNEKVFGCPSDPGVAELDTGISFSWRDEMGVFEPQASLAGKRLGSVDDPSLILVFDSIPGWHGPSWVHAATIQTTSKRFEIGEFEANLDRAVN